MDRYWEKFPEAQLEPPKEENTLERWEEMFEADQESKP